MSHAIQPSARSEYVFAGNARFTLVSKATGARYTYRLKLSDNGGIFFASVLTGPDNTTDYRYAGIVPSRERTAFRTTKGSKLGPSAPSVRALEWFLRHLESEQVEVWHEGRCGRCSRVLTTPESVERGIGPECLERMMGAA